MSNSSWDLVAALMIIVIVVLGVVSCSKTVSHGNALGMDIGSSKEQVIIQLKKNTEITHVRPAIWEHIQINAKSEHIENRLDRLLGEPGLVLKGSSPMLYLKVDVTGSSVRSIYLAPVNNGQNLGLEVGMSTSDVGEIILASIESGKIDRVFNYMPDSDSIEINNLTEAEWNRLLASDTWTFGEKDEYSIIKIHFVNGRLQQINYKWSPIELP